MDGSGSAAAGSLQKIENRKWEIENA